MAALERKIGQLTIEIDWLKKTRNIDVRGRWLFVDSDCRKLSLSHQCRLLGLNRSSYYQEGGQETVYNIELMNLIDQSTQIIHFMGAIE